MRRTSRYLAILVASALAAGCSEPTGPSEAPVAASAPDFGLGSDFADLTPDIQKQLASLRAYLSGMHTVALAARGGFETPVTECREKPGVGGMGYHYANLERIFDTSAPSVLEPEILVFSPGKNGRVLLGAAEYFIPWGEDYPEAGPPPVLFGQEFSPNSGDGGWMLHVWLWNHNPAGIFANWNPTVSCG